MINLFNYMSTNGGACWGNRFEGQEFSDEQGFYISKPSALCNVGKGIQSLISKPLPQMSCLVMEIRKWR